jgi:hypothetical protein
MTLLINSPRLACTSISLLPHTHRNMAYVDRDRERDRDIEWHSYKGSTLRMVMVMIMVMVMVMVVVVVVVMVQESDCLGEDTYGMSSTSAMTPAVYQS